MTHGESFAVQPFSNIVTTKTFTGQQIKDILEQQFKTSAGGSRTLILPVSAGFTYTWQASAPVNSKVSNMMLNGVSINLAGTYRVTANNFLASGGDDFPGFQAGTSEQTGLTTRRPRAVPGRPRSIHAAFGHPDHPDPLTLPRKVSRHGSASTTWRRSGHRSRDPAFMS